MDEAAIKENGRTLDRYVQHIEGLLGCKAFKQPGPKLRRRLHNVGIQWERGLIIVSEKL